MNKSGVMCVKSRYLCEVFRLTVGIGFLYEIIDFNRNKLWFHVTSFHAPEVILPSGGNIELFFFFNIWIFRDFFVIQRLKQPLGETNGGK